MNSRLDPLIAAIESGEPITAADLNRTAALIALDTAAGDDRFVDQFLGDQAEADQVIEN